jgi:lipopolysaccharide heptosyltransferase II
MKNNILDEKEEPTINKILVVQTAFIGDVILITPLIREIKKLFPQSLVDVMVIPQASNLLENNPHINNIVKFDKRRKKTKAFIQSLKLLKKGKYDLAVSPHSSITTALLMLLARIPIRVGFARWSSQILLTHKLQHLKKTLKIKKNLHLLSPFSDEEFSIQTELFPTKDMFGKAENLLSPIDHNSKKIIAIAPGSNWFTKRWPIGSYNKLVKMLNEFGYGIVFIGSSEESEICEDIKPKNNFINTSGKLSLLESAAIISKCDLMICNDSGAMHLANAVNTDVFVFFGPTVKSIGYPPIGNNDIVFEIDLECRPCSSHGTKVCPLGHHNCMHFIQSEFVFEKVQEKFG